MMSHMLVFSSIFSSRVYCVIMFGEFVVTFYHSPLDASRGL